MLHIRLRGVLCYCCTRAISTAQEDHRKNVGSQMRAWQIHSYGGLDELQFSKSTRTPQIAKPNDVMVEIYASSVNPIDIAMLGGYGSTLLGLVRHVSSCSTSRTIEFPMTLGRDFAGRVVGKGHGVNSDMELGDVVWGAQPLHSQGCHAEYAVVDKSLVYKKPSNVTMTEASAIPYAGMTAWCALKVFGGFGLLPTRGKKVLVLGGAGGVGSIAIQLVRAWGCQVVATCNTDAVHLVESLGAHCVIDYTQPGASKSIKEEGKYDLILDAAGLGADEGLNYADCLKDLNLSKYVTLRSPLLRNVDDYGLLPGMAKNAIDLLVPNLFMTAASLSSTVRWGFFLPIPKAMQELTQLVQEGKVMPLVEKVFKFSDLPAAFEHVKSGHLRGKIVLTLDEAATENMKNGQAEHG